MINPNKAGLFEGSFSWGDQFESLKKYKWEEVEVN